jgi:hypothetical protein
MARRHGRHVADPVPVTERLAWGPVQSGVAAFGGTLFALILSQGISTGTVAQAAPMPEPQVGLPPGTLIVNPSTGKTMFAPIVDPMPAEVIPTEEIHIVAPFTYGEVPFTFEDLPEEQKRQLAEQILSAAEREKKAK